MDRDTRATTTARLGAIVAAAVVIASQVRTQRKTTLLTTSSKHFIRISMPTPLASQKLMTSILWVTT